ncbi:MAG: hypothetical protein ACR2NA_00485 [Solirubrobacterales bacterium]
MTARDGVERSRGSWSGVLAGVLLAAVAVAGCGESDEVDVSLITGQETTRTVAGEKLVERRDARGFRIEVPRDWDLDVVSGQIVVASDDEGMVFATPFLAPEILTSEECVDRLPEVLEPALTDASKLGTQPVQGPVDQLGANFAFTRNGKGWRASLVCSIDEKRSGTVLGIAAPARDIVATRGQLAEIAQTFAFAKPRGTARQDRGLAGVKFETRPEPSAGAWSADLPKGWSQTAGFVRPVGGDLRPTVTARSPDGDVQVALGTSDRGVAVDRSRARSGEDESGAPSGPSGRYRTGKAYARERVAGGGGTACTGAKVVSSSEDEDAAFAIESAYAGAGLSVERVTAGAVAFRCGDGRRGWSFAATSLLAGGSWYPSVLAGWVATPGESDKAQGVVARIAGSFEMEDTYVGGARGFSEEAAAAVQTATGTASDAVRRSYWTTRSGVPKRLKDWTLGGLGRTSFAEPDSSRRWRVTPGANYYWRRVDGGEGQPQEGGTLDRPVVDVGVLAGL